MEQPAAPTLNFWDPEFLANPYPTYRRLREADPVHRTSAGSYFLTRFKDVQACLKDDARVPKVLGELFNVYPPGPFATFFTNTTLVMEGPDYHRVRGAMQPQFGPSAMLEATSRIDAIAETLLDTLPRGVELDFVSSFARILPVRAVACVMGVPDPDWPLLLAWTERLTPSFDLCATPQEFMASNQAAEEAGAYFGAKLEQAMKSPGPPSLVQGLAEQVAKGRLTALQAVHNMTLVLVAGGETTSSAIAEGMFQLARDHSLRETVLQNPALLPNVVEEFLRLATPFQLANRFVAVPIEIDSVTIPAGAALALGLAAANRDPAEFSNPDVVDPARPAKQNRHVAFGSGPRFCLGAQLARLELHCAFEKILRRFPRIRLVGEPKHRPGVVLRRVESLRLILE